jgi:hypothetical protein
MRNAECGMIGSDQLFFSGTVGHGTKTETDGTNGTIFLYFSTRSRRPIRSPLEYLVDPASGIAKRRMVCARNSGCNRLHRDSMWHRRCVLVGKAPAVSASPLPSGRTGRPCAADDSAAEQLIDRLSQNATKSRRLARSFPGSYLVTCFGRVSRGSSRQGRNRKMASVENSCRGPRSRVSG